jgi:tetratricopeptide (TPR) repeat protein
VGALTGRRPGLVFVLGVATGAGAAFPLARVLSSEPAKPVVPVAQQIQSLTDESVTALSLGKPEQALPLLVTADSLGLKSEVIQNNLCVTFNQLHRYDDAIEACKVALLLNPDFTLALNNLRWAQAELAKAENRAPATR